MTKFHSKFYQGSKNQVLKFVGKKIWWKLSDLADFWHFLSEWMDDIGVPNIFLDLNECLNETYQ